MVEQGPKLRRSDSWAPAPAHGTAAPSAAAYYQLQMLVLLYGVLRPSLLISLLQLLLLILSFLFSVFMQQRLVPWKPQYRQLSKKACVIPRRGARALWQDPSEEIKTLSVDFLFLFDYLILQNSPSSPIRNPLAPLSLSSFSIHGSGWDQLKTENVSTIMVLKRPRKVKPPSRIRTPTVLS